MIEVQDTALAENAFEDAIEATVFMATVHVREGELGLPERIRAHLADGPVVVHLVRGEHDVAVHEATLTSRSTLTGIEWPDDVQPRTSLTVLCPRGGASHDIGVLLPELPPTVTFLGPVPDEPADDGLCEKCVAPYVDDPEGLGLCRHHLTEHYDAEAAAERQSDDEQDDEDTDTISAVEDVEQTVIAADFGTIAWPADEAAEEDLDDPVVEEEPPAEELASLEVVDVDRDYRPRWRRAAAYVQANWTNARATYIAATGGSFVGSLVTWLVTR